MRKIFVFPQLFQVSYPSPQLPLKSNYRILFTHTSPLHLTHYYLFSVFLFPTFLYVGRIIFTNLTAFVSFFLKTYPNHLNLLSNILSISEATPILYLIYSFLNPYFDFPNYSTYLPQYSYLCYTHLLIYLPIYSSIF